MPEEYVNTQATVQKLFNHQDLLPQLKDRNGPSLLNGLQIMAEVVLMNYE